MFIRVEKCSTFGIRKALTKSAQFLPKLFINGMLIPSDKISESFLYLGRYFSFHVFDDAHKSEITSLIKDLMSNIDSKPLHPKNKLLLYSRYVLSKVSWHFTLYSFQYISNLGKRKYRFCGKQLTIYIRRWLEIPISGTLCSVFMTRNKFGLNIFHLLLNSSNVRQFSEMH